ncbi:MAG TPA: sigma-70 family RNA polymerase sigma factor [Steroidobacter sp.]|uniref:RNA polymerase sigma factor n=1 Tax=Steroidobacter sp. TaxID=1978227 RepID=UPI002ED99BB3
MKNPLASPNSSAADATSAPDSRAELLAHLDRRFRLPLLAYFGRRVRSAPEAEDLTQDVFERLLRSLESKPIANPEALVFSIAVNLLRDRWRRANTHGVAEPIPAEAVAEFVDVLTVDLSPERVVLGERTLEEAFSALDELGERTRTMFYLYRFEGLKIREIADMYGISASGVEKQLEKALMHLTRRLYQP